MKINLRTGYLSHIITLLSGTAFAQIVLLIALPFLTRLFSPADFGLYGVFVAITSILGMVANGRFDLAILIPKNEEDAQSVYKISYQFALGLFCILCIVAFAFPDRYLGEYKALIWWVPLSVLLQGLLQPATRWLLRSRSFKKITVSKIAGSVFTVGISIGLAFLDFGFEGLVLGKIGGQLVETVIAGGFSAFRFNLFKWDQAIFSTYIGFLKFSSFEALLNNFFKQIPILALSGYFGEALAGFYTLAMNVTSRPSGMVSQSVSQVFFKEGSEMEEEAFSNFFLKNVKGLFLLIIVPSLVVFLFGDVIFAVLFGKEWLQAGIYASWLIPFVLITFIKAGVSSVIDLKNKMRNNLLFEMLFVVLSLVSFTLGWWFTNADLGVILFSVFNSCLGLVQLFYFYKWSKLSSGFQ
ncbi:MAG: oligosaccharide flippase family protein [Saprospiraceae bacterium]|nr:oligosaccharide flippase family protein [Saprospiraceae bacterium]